MNFFYDFIRYEMKTTFFIESGIVFPLWICQKRCLQMCSYKRYIIKALSIFYAEFFKLFDNSIHRLRIIHLFFKLFQLQFPPGTMWIWTKCLLNIQHPQNWFTQFFYLC